MINIKTTNEIPLRIRASNFPQSRQYRTEIADIIQEIKLSNIVDGAFLVGIEIGEGIYEIHPKKCNITECTLRNGEIIEIRDKATAHANYSLYETFVTLYSK